MAEGVFGTVINCMDGRVQLPVNEYLRNNYNLDFVDTITEAGPVKMLAENQAGVESIKTRVNVSIERHNSGIVAIVTHFDCAGNPVPKETQLAQLAQAINLTHSWNPHVQCIGLWVNDKWNVEMI